MSYRKVGSGPEKVDKVASNNKTLYCNIMDGAVITINSGAGVQVGNSGEKKIIRHVKVPKGVTTVSGNA